MVILRIHIALENKKKISCQAGAAPIVDKERRDDETKKPGQNWIKRVAQVLWEYAYEIIVVFNP